MVIWDAEKTAEGEANEMWDLEHLLILKPLERKRKERTCLICNQLEASLPSKGRAYGSGNVYSENCDYPEKIQGAF